LSAQQQQQQQMSAQQQLSAQREQLNAQQRQLDLQQEQLTNQEQQYQSLVNTPAVPNSRVSTPSVFTPSNFGAPFTSMNQFGSSQSNTAADQGGFSIPTPNVSGFAPSNSFAPFRSSSSVPSTPGPFEDFEMLGASPAPIAYGTPSILFGTPSQDALNLEFLQNPLGNGGRSTTTAPFQFGVTATPPRTPSSTNNFQGAQPASSNQFISSSNRPSTRASTGRLATPSMIEREATAQYQSIQSQVATKKSQLSALASQLSSVVIPSLTMQITAQIVNLGQEITQLQENLQSAEQQVRSSQDAVENARLQYEQEEESNRTRRTQNLEPPSPMIPSQNQTASDVDILNFYSEMARQDYLIQRLGGNSNNNTQGSRASGSGTLVAPRPTVRAPTNNGEFAVPVRMQQKRGASIFAVQPADGSAVTSGKKKKKSTTKRDLASRTLFAEERQSARADGDVEGSEEEQEKQPITKTKKSKVVAELVPAVYGLLVPTEDSFDFELDGEPVLEDIRGSKPLTRSVVFLDYELANDRINGRGPEPVIISIRKDLPTVIGWLYRTPERLTEQERIEQAIASDANTTVTASTTRDRVIITVPRTFVINGQEVTINIQFYFALGISYAANAARFRVNGVFSEHHMRAFAKAGRMIEYYIQKTQWTKVPRTITLVITLPTSISPPGTIGVIIQY